MSLNISFITSNSQKPEDIRSMKTEGFKKGQIFTSGRLKPQIVIFD